MRTSIAPHLTIPALCAALAFAACGSSEEATTASADSAKKVVASGSAPTAAASAKPAASAAATPSASASAAAKAPSTRASKPEKLGSFELHPLYHGTLWFKVEGAKPLIVWVDPWSEANLDDGPKADVILITDVHPDHFDEAAIAKVKGDKTTIVAPVAVTEKLKDAKALKNGGKLVEGPLTIEAVPMYNLKRGPSEGKLFHDKGRGNGYVLTADDKRVYISGDTECTDEMKALKNIDLAFVSMNLPYTMPPSEAAECVKAFKPKILIPYHYRDQNLGDLDAPLKDSGVEVRKHDLY
jgi:L-ascorbate metabolism protein UlaG (beta-lactamase superfamily)